MQRSSSFFWASDDLREHGEGEEGDDACLILEEEDDGQNAEPSENIALNRNCNNFDSCYGSSSSASIPPKSCRRMIFQDYETGTEVENKTIRFQVVIWHISSIDVQTGSVKMRFRLTLFWDDNDDSISHNNELPKQSREEGWVMEGRQRATKILSSSVHETGTKETIDVPPISILNAVEFETVDAPEIVMINKQTRSMRWTCMYSATLDQGDHLTVHDFPHDIHRIKLKVGVLFGRGKGGRWDHTIYKLALADERDSQGSTTVPYGLIVEHCRLPDFGFASKELQFDFLPLEYGGQKKKDVFLQVALPVYRQSGHYDRSILPLLTMLNIIAISCLLRNFGSASASAELMLSIAFVQVGIRLTLDSRLPTVGYQIKMQRVMNLCFWLVSGLVLESNFVFFLVQKCGWEIYQTDRIDLIAACIALVYNACIIWIYFSKSVRSLPVRDRGGVIPG